MAMGEGKSKGVAHRQAQDSGQQKSCVHGRGVGKQTLSFFALVCCPKLNAYGAAAMPIDETLATSALSNTSAV